MQSIIKTERNFFKRYNNWYILLPQGFKELMLKVAGHKSYHWVLKGYDGREMKADDNVILYTSVEEVTLWGCWFLR
jgi:hypothetical protein